MYDGLVHYKYQGLSVYYYKPNVYYFCLVSTKNLTGIQKKFFPCFKIFIDQAFISEEQKKRIFAGGKNVMRQFVGRL